MMLQTERQGIDFERPELRHDRFIGASLREQYQCPSVMNQGVVRVALNRSIHFGVGFRPVAMQPTVRHGQRRAPRRALRIDRHRASRGRSRLLQIFFRHAGIEEGKHDQRFRQALIRQRVLRVRLNGALKIVQRPGKTIASSLMPLV